MLENEQAGFIERMVKLVDKYGIFKIIQALFVLFAFCYIMYNVSNLDSIVENVFTSQSVERKNKHDDAVEIRRAIKPEVDIIMRSTLSQMNADRVFVIEMHNGTNSVAGLPFIYGEMTYEEVKRGVHHIDEDYTSLNLSRFTFPLYLEEHHMWCGTITELEGIDSKLALRLRGNDVKYLAVIQMHGVTNELGYYGFTYTNSAVPENVKDIKTALSINAQKLATLLDTADDK